MRNIPTNNLQYNPIVLQLGLTLPTQYNTEGDKPLVKSKQVQSICQQYLKIISALLKNAQTQTNELQLKTTQQNSLENNIKENERTISRWKSAHQTVCNEKARLDTRLQLLVSNFGRLANTGDIVFRAGQDDIQAHSAIVSLWSDPFARMLQSTMREGLTKKIELLDEDPLVVKSMVTYFYTADIIINEGNAFPLLRLSSMYDIPSLRSLCCEYFTRHTTIDTCLPLFAFTLLHHREKALEWTGWVARNSIMKHAQEILEKHTPSLLSFALNDLFQIWPLFKEATQKVQSGTFLTWATAHWKVDDLPECISCISAMLGSLEIECQLPTHKSLQYFFRFCLMAVVEDFDAQSQQKGFAALASEHLISILQDDKLNVASEHVVLDSVLAWVQAADGRDTHLPILLKCIRFPFVDISYLVKIPAIYPQIGSTDAFKALLQDALQHQVGALNVNKRPAEDGENCEEERKRRRTCERYQLPAPNASEFASFVTAAVIQSSSSKEGQHKDTQPPT
eukprot:Phypoly_transcript_06702.p1 GENE.Phypoly_transcript_06702~~Phypoly_transcript_06702.p1  ORF type:complete len:509 (+),score=56.76 Phypoly_transcript_06702:19-1545(+)